ncbi:hypothetical protein A1Q2_05919 [Trichosporon asahii var. asahii CBS 8904]|uniref:Secreted protein n=1 Tax=Trichosporon asahii var. asahii (strain CBS 8904) TaxID=1220162 RepID=K1WDU8_TRIAC|nr:hypothetical protein A1Q2_05919 [Trichosporon asahii var. asahii CBS 8904]
MILHMLSMQSVGFALGATLAQNATRDEWRDESKLRRVYQFCPSHKKTDRAYPDPEWLRNGRIRISARLHHSSELPLRVPEIGEVSEPNIVLCGR